MSEWRRNALLGALLVAFVALAVAINAVLGEDAESPPSPKSALVKQREAVPGADEPRSIEAPGASQKNPPQARDDAERSASHETAPPEQQIERRDRGVLAHAAPVAHRFLRVFARYEVGDLGARTRAGLRATATAPLFSELVSEPPRLPQGAQPRQAHPAGSFDVVPIAADPSRRELLEIELVTSFVRAGQGSPIAIRLRLVEGRWRVSGLTR